MVTVGHNKISLEENTLLHDDTLDVTLWWDCPWYSLFKKVGNQNNNTLKRDQNKVCAYVYLEYILK